MNSLLKTFFSLLVLVLLATGAAAQKKYDVKSGIITFENSIRILAKPVPQRQILYFDEYGMKERKELYEGDVLMEAFLSDGRHLFNLVFEESTAYRSGRAVQGTETRFDGDSLSAVWKKKGTVKKLAAMKIAGRLCDAYELVDAGGTTILAGWNHITLFTDNAAVGIHSVSKAVTIEENAKVPAEMFRVPPGFVIK